MHSSAITPVFYLKKHGSVGSGDLELEDILGKINWGEATDLIKYDGFYMFGGKKQNNEASNSLIVI